MIARGRAQPASRRNGWVPGLAGALLLSVGMAGFACSHKDPNKPLTDPEGQALLDDIRKHPPTPDDLTPAEKTYLGNYLATHK